MAPRNIGILISLGATGERDFTTLGPDFQNLFVALRTIACAIIIFGIVSIFQYNRKSVQAYAIFYCLMCLIAMALSGYLIVELVMVISDQKNSIECNPMVQDNCVREKDYFFLGLNIIQIIFWGFSTSFILRFNYFLRKKHLIWLETHKESDMLDSSFRHWCSSYKI